MHNIYVSLTCNQVLLLLMTKYVALDNLLLVIKVSVPAVSLTVVFKLIHSFTFNFPNRNLYFSIRPVKPHPTEIRPHAVMRVTRQGVRVGESCERKESGNPKRTKLGIIDVEDHRRRSRRPGGGNYNDRATTKASRL